MFPKRASVETSKPETEEEEVMFTAEGVKESTFGPLKVQVLEGKLSDQDTAAVKFKHQGENIIKIEKKIIKT